MMHKFCFISVFDWIPNGLRVPKVVISGQRKSGSNAIETGVMFGLVFQFSYLPLTYFLKSTYQ